MSVDRLVPEGVQDPTAIEDLEVNFFLPLILIAYLGVSIYLCYCNIHILPILSKPSEFRTNVPEGLIKPFPLMLL